MSEQKIKNLRKQKMPDCCSNCEHLQWNESGSQCFNPKNYELDEGHEVEWIAEETDFIEWDEVCDNYEREKLGKQ